MRCPKCGYISFDNVDKCLKCKKNISESTKAFQGSTLNVATPVFLKLPPSADDDGAALDDDDYVVLEKNSDYVDPDLEILVGGDNDQDEGIAFSLEDDTAEEPAAELNLADEFGDMATFDDEDEKLGDDFAADLGQFEEAVEETPPGFEGLDEEPKGTAANLEFPEELSDISDLSAPAAEEISQEEAPEAPLAAGNEALAADPEGDLDFRDLDMEFDLDGLDDPAPAPPETSTAPAKNKKQKPEDRTDMDEDLDFELDLGGLSIHDDK